jgi:hypothetical protein
VPEFYFGHRFLFLSLSIVFFLFLFLYKRLGTLSLFIRFFLSFFFFFSSSHWFGGGFGAHREALAARQLAIKTTGLGAGSALTTNDTAKQPAEALFFFSQFLIKFCGSALIIQTGIVLLFLSL